MNLEKAWIWYLGLPLDAVAGMLGPSLPIQRRSDPIRQGTLLFAHLVKMRQGILTTNINPSIEVRRANKDLLPTIFAHRHLLDQHANGTWGKICTSRLCGISYPYTCRQNQQCKYELP